MFQLFSLFQAVEGTPFIHSLTYEDLFSIGDISNVSIGSHWFWSIWYQMFDPILSVPNETEPVTWLNTSFGLYLFNNQILNFKIILMLLVSFYCRDVNTSHDHNVYHREQLKCLTVGRFYMLTTLSSQRACKQSNLSQLWTSSLQSHSLFFNHFL